MNDLDWEHVIEEIEGLGNSEIAQVGSPLGQAIVHALKAARWPDSPSARHWQAEAVNVLEQAQDRYRPSMAKALDLARRFARARKAVLAMAHDGPTADIPEATTLSLAEVMDRDADLRALIDRLAGGAAPN